VLDESTDAESNYSSDGERDVFFEAEEQLSTSPPAVSVHLPEELITEILSKLLEEVVDETTLRAASLVSKEWSGPARRLFVLFLLYIRQRNAHLSLFYLRLFSQILPLTTSDVVKRLRGVLDSRPELARAVRSVDLSNPGSSAWQDGKAGDTLRRAAGVLRSTPNVSDVSLLHVALNDKVRRRFCHLFSLFFR
jgi:hypothetical protein